MTSKTIKIVLFASLIVALILPFSGMNFAEAVSGNSSIQESNEKYAFLEEATSQTGNWEQTKTNGEYVETWKWDVKDNKNKKDVVLNILVVDGEGNQVADDLIKFKVKYDKKSDTYEVDNEKLKETKKFTKSQYATDTEPEITVTSSFIPEAFAWVTTGNPDKVGTNWSTSTTSSTKIGSSQESSCGDTWYVDYFINGATGFRQYSYDGHYNFLEWCIFPNNISHADIYISSTPVTEHDIKSGSFIGTHTEYDSVGTGTWVFMQVTWIY